MSLAGSIGTSRGMRMWYMKKPKCKHCPTVNKKGKPVKPKILFKHGAADIGMCTGCFKRITGENYSDQYMMFVSDPTNKNRGYNNYIKWLRDKIKQAQLKK